MFEILILSLALSMDAFAVSIGLGIKENQNIKVLALKVALFFGIFQAFMPFIGYIGGIGLQEYIYGFDKIIAFALLLLIGAKMIFEAVNENVEEEITKISNKILLTLAIATSIDAMAAGFTLNLLDLNPFISMLIIGIVTLVFSFIGVFIGTKGGTFLEDKAEKIGGVILIGIGLKILIEHLFFH